MFESPFI